MRASGLACRHLTAPLTVAGLCAAQTPRHLLADSLKEPLQRGGLELDTIALAALQQHVGALSNEGLARGRAIRSHTMHLAAGSPIVAMAHTVLARCCGVKSCRPRMAWPRTTSRKRSLGGCFMVAHALRPAEAMHAAQGHRGRAQGPTRSIVEQCKRNCRHRRSYRAEPEATPARI